MPEVLILADDLSGAADCGIACVKAGLDAEVSLGTPDRKLSARVVAIDADTRVMDVGSAAQRMRELVTACNENPSVRLFKKIDSTLRGHLTAELQACLEARRACVADPIAIFAPAFPAIGRTTQGGMHLVHGRPLHETEMWRYERMTGEAHIPAMLERGGLKTRHLLPSQVRRMLADNNVRSEMSREFEVLVCDAADDGELRAVAELAAVLGERAVWVGSAGLAYHLPFAAGLAATAGNIEDALPFASGPTLFVLGSASSRTRAQTTTLLSSSDIYAVVIPPDVLLEGPGAANWQAFSDDLHTAIAGGHDALLLCDSEPVIEAALRPRLSLAMAEMTSSLRGQVGTLIASGGETARKVLDRWGVRSMHLYGEIETGVPVSSANLRLNRPLTVITKAGDFGRPETLLDCLHWSHERRLQTAAEGSHR